MKIFSRLISRRRWLLPGFLLMGALLAPVLIVQQQGSSQEPDASANASDKKMEDSKLETAYFGAGCFWCVEAVFQQLDGVQAVESGYMGGQVDHPTYEQVCSGTTGHAEIARIQFDPEVVSFKDLLEVFWKTHDPTTLNRQGNDEGTQYRSAVFYTSDAQKELAVKYRQRLNEEQAFSAPIVTEITAASKFHSAGDYHANYFLRNPSARYCQSIIRPKVDKFRNAFADKLKKPVAK